MSEVVSADDADRDFGVCLCKKKKRARLIRLGPEDIGQKQRGVADRRESVREGWKIVQGLNLGGGEKFTEKCGQLGSGIGILLSQKNRGHKWDSAREAGWTEGGILRLGRGRSGVEVGTAFGERDAMDGVGSAEAVIDIDYGNPGGAGVEHSKKCGDSLKVGSVTYGCGDGNEGGADKSAQNAREGSFHSGDNNQGVVVAEGIEMSKGSVQACNTDVIESGGAVPKKFKGDIGFFCNGVIGGSCCTDGDIEGRLERFGSAGGCKGEGSGGGVIFRLGKKATEVSGFRRVNPSGEDGLSGRAEASDDG